MERPQQAAARAARRLGRVGGVRGDERCPAAPRRPGERGRVPHRPRRRLHRHVVPLLRPEHAAVVDLLGRQPPLRRARPAGRSARSPATSASSRETTPSAAGRSVSASRGPASTTPTPRWEQAFSDDGGETWETNWVDGVHAARERDERLSRSPRSGRLPARDEGDHARRRSRSASTRAEVVRHRTGRRAVPLAIRRAGARNLATAAKRERSTSRASSAS